MGFMLTRVVRKFLRQPRIAHLATLGRNGYPHIVPVYFLLDGDDIVFGSDDNEQKVKNARRHPQGAVVIGGDPATDDAGYMFQGSLHVARDPSRKLIKRMRALYESGSDAEEWEESDSVIIRLKPRRVIRVW